MPTTIAAGSTDNVALTFKNTGNVTWNRSENYRIGTSSPIDNTTFGTGRVDMGVASVAPGQSATFNFQVKAPAAAGSYLFDWGMLWEGNWRFGQTSAIRIAVTAAATKPTVDVFRLPSRPVAGQAFITTWGTTGATSLTQVCAAAGTGYKVSQALSVNGTRTETAQQAWVGYPSTCVWTVTGPGGTATYTEQVETVANTSSKPGISVTRNSAPVAGQSFTTAWTTSNATSLTRVCTASGTGYKVNESLAVNGSRTDTALAAWVGYPSSCTWTASGAGGTTTHVETVTTTAAASGGVTYIHTDGLGSPVARTDAAGQVISRTRYEPYGYVAGGAAPTVGFTGHVNDAETGLTYMQQRYYDPVAGRFLSIDPVVTEANTGDSFNRYAYANNSPYKYIDPDGRSWTLAGRGAVLGAQGGFLVCGPWCGAAGAVVGGAITGYGGYKGLQWIESRTDANPSGAKSEETKSADSGDKDPSTPTGQRGSPLDVKDGTNKPTNIGGRDYSGHAVDRMQGRGVPPSVVDDAVRNGKAEPGNRPNTTVHTGESGVRVVTNQDGKVITFIN